MNETLNQIRNRIDELMSQKERVIVAIDGNCTAGKTTLAGKLAERYDCNVIHMDDFFLRPEQRTPERYAGSERICVHRKEKQTKNGVNHHEKRRHQENRGVHREQDGLARYNNLLLI